MGRGVHCMPSAMLKKLVYGQANVFGDLAQQDRRDVAAGAEEDGGRTPVGMRNA